MSNNIELKITQIKDLLVQEFLEDVNLRYDALIADNNEKKEELKKLSQEELDVEIDKLIEKWANVDIKSLYTDNDGADKRKNIKLANNNLNILQLIYQDNPEKLQELGQNLPLLIFDKNIDEFDTGYLDKIQAEVNLIDKDEFIKARDSYFKKMVDQYNKLDFIKKFYKDDEKKIEELNEAVFQNHLNLASREGIAFIEDCIKEVDGDEFLKIYNDYYISRIATSENTEIMNFMFDNQARRIFDDVQDSGAGYCLRSLTHTLHKQNAEYGIYEFMPEKLEDSIRNIYLVPHLVDNYKEYIIHNNDTQSVADIISKNSLQPGAIIISDNKSGTPQHAMLYTHTDGKGEHTLMGFNNESKKTKLTRINNANVVNLPGLIEQSIKRAIEGKTISEQESILAKLEQQITSKSVIDKNFANMLDEGKQHTPEEQWGTYYQRADVLSDIKQKTADAQIRMQFDRIINSISPDYVEATHLTQLKPKLERSLSEVDTRGTAEDKIKLQNSLQAINQNENVANFKEKSPDDTLKNIAYFARVIAKVHPGFESGLYNNTKFKGEIVKLYQSQINPTEDNKISGDELLKRFTKIIETTIPDNHLSIVNKEGQDITTPEDREEYKDTSLVGKKKATVENNVASNLPEGYKALHSEVLEGLEPDKGSLLIAESIDNINGKKVGLIAFNTCRDDFGTSHKEQWENILQAFRDNHQNWDSIIIDVRGNGGGDNYQLQEIAQTLYGNQVPYSLEAQRRDTPEAGLQEYDFGCGKPQEKWSEYKYPFKGNANQEILILTDRHVGSAAESIIPMLAHHPKAKTIGENSGGCCQFGGIVPINMPNGAKINIGSVLRTYENGLVETRGHNPDINCSGGQDAFVVATRVLEDRYNSNHKYLKTLTPEEKATKFEEREYSQIHSTAFNSTIDSTLEMIKSSELGKELLLGANYKEVDENKFNQAKENNVFALEKIYIGEKYGPKGGHCGFISAINDDKNIANARGEIFINVQYINNAIKNLGQNDASIYLSNLLTHEILHANQRTHIENEPENSRSEIRKAEARARIKARVQTDNNDNIDSAYERNVLYESASMAAGLTMLNEVINKGQVENKTKVIDYMIDDFAQIGNMSKYGVNKLKSMVERLVSTEQERQELSRDLFTTIVASQTSYLKENKGLELDFNSAKANEMFDIVYQGNVFGNKETATQVKANIDKEIKIEQGIVNIKNKISPNIKKPENKEIDTKLVKLDLSKMQINKSRG